MISYYSMKCKWTLYCFSLVSVQCYLVILRCQIVAHFARCNIQLAGLGRRVAHGDDEGLVCLSDAFFYNSLL